MIWKMRLCGDIIITQSIRKLNGFFVIFYYNFNFKTVKCNKNGGLTQRIPKNVNVTENIITALLRTLAVIKTAGKEVIIFIC